MGISSRTAARVTLAVFMIGAVAGAAGFSVKVSASGRYFTDAQGAPWWFQGDTEWELFRLVAVADVKPLIDKRVSQGFSAFQVMLNGVPAGNGGLSGLQPWLNNNPATPDESYFKHVDSVVNVCAAYNAIFVVGVFHYNEGSIWNAHNARAYARFVATRYQAVPNIVWCMYPAADNSYTAIIDSIAAGLAEGDGGAHLITVHPDPAPASASFWNRAWIAFNTMQVYASDITNYQMVAADYAKTPVKPAVDGEAIYEAADGTSALDIRHGSYWANFAGGFYSYGHANNWQSPATWSSWVNSAGANSMKLAGDFFRSLSWWKLSPDQTVISGAAGQKAAMRSSDGDVALVYLPASGSVTVNMSKLTAGSTVVASWFNPSDGGSSSAGSSANTGTKSFTSPSGWQDAVLVLKAGTTLAADHRVMSATSSAPREETSLARRAGVSIAAGTCGIDAAGRRLNSEPFTRRRAAH